MKNLGKRQQEMDFVTSIHTKYCKKKALLFHADWYTKKNNFFLSYSQFFLSMYVLAVHHKCHATIFQSIYASVLDICALLSYFLFSEQKKYTYFFFKAKRDVHCFIHSYVIRYTYNKNGSM